MGGAGYRSPHPNDEAKLEYHLDYRASLLSLEFYFQQYDSLEIAGYLELFVHSESRMV